MRAADAGFEHASAPARYGVRVCNIVHASGLAEAAYAPELDVDDAAGVHADGLFRVMHGANAFVEADGGLKLRLERRVIEDIVMRQGLLDHHQVEFVQALQVIGVGQRVGGVGIGHQPDVGERGAHFTYDIDIPARLDLDFDALIAGVELRFDFLQELRDAVLNADRDA